MLYLIKDRDYLKIGYASNIKDRMKGYRTHTLYTELIDVKPGNTTDEKQLHELCKDYCVESEWFKNCQEVIDIWNTYQPTVIKDLDKIKNIIDLADEELSKSHLKLYENWPTEPKIILSILNSINSQKRNQAIKSIDFDYPEMEKYKDLEKDYNDLLDICKAFEGKAFFYFYIDEYEYECKRTYEDNNTVRVTMNQTIIPSRIKSKMENEEN